MKYVLDTSAVLAHLLDEAGADRVEQLLAAGPETVTLAAPSWVELDRRLRALVADDQERTRIFQHYTEDLCGLVTLDRAATLAALRIQGAATQRIPLADALIAGCAHAAQCTLVHRDPHFDAVPVALLHTERLPDKPCTAA